MLVGGFLAILGIVYFSLQPSPMEGVNKPLDIEMAVLFLPRFGALFFIEFIAFFFLKQYRITMDDFKYYESLKRQRESNLFLLKLLTDSKLKEGKTKEELDSMINTFNLFNNPNVLQASETTENLEARKLSNDDMKTFENLVAQLNQSKK